jgi:predicted transcriptional regulator
MSLTVELPADMESELHEIARETGSTPEAVVKDLIARRLAVRHIDEALAPFRKEVAASGMTEDELDAFFQDVREEVWQDQQGGKP